MSKRVSIFELVEGIKYSAHKDGHTFSRRYEIKGGKLFNSDGDQADEDGDSVGCSWIPMGLGVEFQALGSVPKGAKSANELSKAKGAVSVLMLKEGVTYTSKSDDLDPGRKIIRKGANLFYAADKQNGPEEKLTIRELSLETTFTPVKAKPVVKKKMATKNKVKTKLLVAASKKKKATRSKSASR